MIKSLILALSLLAVCNKNCCELELVDPIRSVMHGNVRNPRRLETMDECSGTLGKAATEAIFEQMDFDTHDVLLFEWSGSGQDELSIKNQIGRYVVFEYTPGRTRDLRQHCQAYAIKKGMQYNIP